MNFLPFALPETGEEEIAEVADTIRSGWMTTGPKVARFEKDFAEYVGARYALAVCIWPWRRRVSVPAIW